MVKLDYTEASVLGGMPRVQEELTLSQYMYAIGLSPPRYPVPSIHARAYVLACGITDSGALVIWCADHEVIAV